MLASGATGDAPPAGTSGGSVLNRISSVTGTLQASVPAPEPGAIPWLLLRAVANQGDGVLGQVDFVQRIETRGRMAPAGSCDPARDSTIAVPYRARYVFYAG